MIITSRPPRNGSACDRLIRALALRGHGVGDAASPSAAGSTLLVCPAPDEDAHDLRAWPAALAHATNLRLLIVTRLGTHPDARSPRLRECWRLEEVARSTGLAVLVLRLGPMLGPGSPLWLRLRSGPRLPHGGRKPLNPVAEADAVESLDRALRGTVRWSGWYEVAAPEVWSLAELAELARGAGPPLPAGAGAWEPPLEEMQEHRLAEAEPWLGHFRLEVRPLAEQAREWATTPTGRVA